MLRSFCICILLVGSFSCKKTDDTYTNTHTYTCTCYYTGGMLSGWTTQHKIESTPEEADSVCEKQCSLNQNGTLIHWEVE